MIDILEYYGGDLKIQDTILPRAKNLLETEEGYLFYFNTWGINLKFFLDPSFLVQNETFISYLQQKITQWGMSIIQLNNFLQDFISHINITLKNSSEVDDNSLIL